MEHTMPNGGQPMKMLLRPQEGDVVLLADGGSLRVYARPAFEADPRSAVPLCSLSRLETEALVRQLSYWLGHQQEWSHYLSREDLDITYDY
jgi:hypothetical protein